ncbi:hypothetical protein CD30_18605 [Ureibacillus massiliensis 4400831 = CIP 108448 = CCUG 49529]|uniref:DUF3784 domain-containing protein n=1 Tax=Ureibacillus massiliensis 4400831 = CIP 108448 = CCUG 49529 TaxID=1211035 RepID=A0A0A3ITD6_9BACL|nr:hypothetical protein [Ureibacillus massiliensis]KGR87981.1 hypothetical protein CD30_18605 [Ureibacillus massiliensis 4400831 = CIP 108448 = CCUG 49529]BDH63573.1 hypothetical protein MTP04_37030 [Lysinibacillus sp. PLM2]
MGMLGILGFLSLVCAMLIVKDEKKYKPLIKACGLKDNPKFATTYYSIIGLLLVIGSFISDSYISEFIIPVFVFTFSVLMSAIIIIKKSNKQETF